MAAKIYDVRWVDADGAQGYYVKMSKGQAGELQVLLEEAAQKGKIAELQIDPIEGERLVSVKQLLEEFEQRYYM